MSVSFAGKQEHCSSRLSTTALLRIGNVPVENITDTLIISSTSFFSGSAIQVPAEWLRQFTNYCTYKIFTDVQALNLFRVMLTGSLSFSTKIVLLSMTLRRPFYCVTGIGLLKLLNTKALVTYFRVNRRTVRALIPLSTRCKKNAQIVGMSGDTLQLAILNGLLLHLQNFVLQKEPKILQDLISAARLAELTIPAKKDTDTTLHAKLDKTMQCIED